METRIEGQDRTGTMRTLTAAETAAVLGGVADIIPVRDSKIPADR